jgi:hypothetical protein
MSAITFLIEIYAVIKFTNLVSKCNLSLQSLEVFYCDMCFNKTLLQSFYNFLVLFSVFGRIL